MPDTPQSSRSQDRAGILRKVSAEMVGTFTLVFAGCGAVMVNVTTNGALGHVGVSLTFGLAITIMIYATGHISGAHFNPAVTIAFASIRRFPWSQVPAYLGGQFLAAGMAAGLLRALLGPVAAVGATVPSVGLGSAVVFEAILTFFLMYVITAVATDARAEGAMAGLAIGGTVAMASLFGGPLTGASMNPARSLGPALATGDLSWMPLYLIVPCLGAVAGAKVYAWTQQCDDTDGSPSGGCC